MVIRHMFDKSMSGLEKALDLTWKRNEAIVSNIANAETPQYRATDLNFAGELERAFGGDPSSVTKSNEKHMDIKQGESSYLIQDFTGATKPDGNNVDIDVQMGRLAYNSGKYSAAANLARKKFQMITNAIKQVA